jgi:phenylacetate-CoA ligase
MSIPQKHINKRIMLPLSDLINGTEIAARLCFLEKSQSWSRNELEAYQDERLRYMIKYACQNIPFYNETFRELHLTPSDIQTRADLDKLPVITKDTVRRTGIERFLDQSSDRKHWISFYSSGSTGEPFQYYLSRESFSMKYASAIRGWSWMGFSLGDSYAKLSQNERKGWNKKLQDKVNRCSYYFIPDLRPTTLLQVIQRLQNDKPSFLRCYPDPLYFMAQQMRDEGIRFQWVKAINTTGNILTPEARNLIENQFGCKLYDSYSCEGSAMYFQADGFEGYLGSMESAITEVIDQDGHAVEEGGTGLHITTELWNTAMPFIRYNTQDLVILSAGTGNHSGRQLFALDRIVGRDNDVLIAPDGNRLIVHLFTIYFEYFNSIRQFQVEQTTSDEFIFRLVVDSTFTKEIEKKIHDYWVRFLNGKANVIIEIHKQIPLCYSGKRRFLIRNKSIT